MKAVLQKAFSPILNTFEKGNTDYEYRPSHRKILIAIGTLFSMLCGFIILLTQASEGFGFLIPVVVFGGVSLVTLVVGFLGTDEAVANIWNSKRQ